MVAELNRSIQTEVSHIQKAEWLLAYVKARSRAFSSFNIHSAWNSAGLIPFESGKVLRGLPPTISASLPATPTAEITTPLHNPPLNSSLVNVPTFYAANNAVAELVSTNQLLNTLAHHSFNANNGATFNTEYYTTTRETCT
jgi:hypothetical protein